jgi:hypothetical protein
MVWWLGGSCVSIRLKAGWVGWWWCWEGKVDRVEARRRSNGNSTSPASYEKFEKRQKGKKKKFLAFFSF